MPKRKAVEAGVGDAGAGAGTGVEVSDAAAR